MLQTFVNLAEKLDVFGPDHTVVPSGALYFCSRHQDHLP